MSIKKSLSYVAALVAALVAIFAIVRSISDHKDTPESWDALSASVEQVGAAADLTADTAITNKDKEVCIVSKSVSSLAGGVAESAASAKDGTCRIPDVNINITACLWDAAPAAPVVLSAPVSEGDAVEAPVVAEAPAAPVLSTDVPAAVELALDPLMVAVQGALAKSDASPVVKAWGAGVLTWLDSGRPSIIALVENPAEGKLSFKGVDIEGCTP